jgi:hypothetical protein
MFKTHSSKIWETKGWVATSTRAQRNYGNALKLEPSWRGSRRFPDSAARAKRNPIAEITFRRFSHVSHSLWKLSHSERIPSAFGTHSIPIRHSFALTAIACGPKTPLSTHIVNLGNSNLPASS